MTSTSTLICIARRLGMGGVALALSAATVASLVDPGLARATTLSAFAVPTAGSKPTGISAGPDGNLWFTESAANQIGQINTSGQLTEYVIPTPNSQPQYIATGPDGALWFTEYTGNKIGRVTTSGQFIEYQIPTASANPEAIASGPDGALWFTELAGNKIGRVTTSGQFTEYPIPTPTSNALGIATGPDGALWFTELGAFKIGRVTTNGQFTEYPIPTAGSHADADSIVAGPDGALWFTEYSNNRIGRVTTSGQFTEYFVPTAAADPQGIVAGPDSALWFTEHTGDKIGRISTDGQITQYGIPTSSPSPIGIATGADHGLWFSEMDANSIGQLCPTCTPPATTTSGAGTGTSSGSTSLGAGLGSPSLPAFERGMPNGTSASDGAQFKLEGRNVITVPYAKRAIRVHAQLVGTSARPITGASVDVLTRTATYGATMAQIAKVRTDGKGQLSLVIPAGPSRLLRLGYRSHANDPGYTANADITEHVRAGLTLSARPGNAGPGATVRFGGKLLGGYIPPGGKLLLLQVHFQGAWRTVGQTTAISDGTYVVRYKFASSPIPPTRFSFRIQAPTENGYPYTLANSPARSVRVQ